MCREFTGGYFAEVDKMHSVVFWDVLAVLSTRADLRIGFFCKHITSKNRKTLIFECFLEVLPPQTMIANGRVLARGARKFYILDSYSIAFIALLKLSARNMLATIIAGTAKKIKMIEKQKHAVTILITQYIFQYGCRTDFKVIALIENIIKTMA